MSDDPEHVGFFVLFVLMGGRAVLGVGGNVDLVDRSRAESREDSV